MREELEVSLQEEFPQIFQDIGGNPIMTWMTFGLECGGGWYDLIRKLCRDIMNTGPPENLRAVQVKEKFGGLRFYITGGTDDVFKLIEQAEEDSYRICEKCGATEEVKQYVRHGWVSTRCEPCHDFETTKPS